MIVVVKTSSNFGVVLQRMHYDKPDCNVVVFLGEIARNIRVESHKHYTEIAVDLH